RKLDPYSSCPPRQIPKPRGCQVPIALCCSLRLLLKCVQHVNRLCKRRDVDDAVRPCLIADANFAYAPANRRHRLPISGIKPPLDAIELKSRFLSRSFRKRAQFAQGVAAERDQFQPGPHLYRSWYNGATRGAQVARWVHAC